MFASAPPSRVRVAPALVLTTLSMLTALACGGPVPPKTGTGDAAGGGKGEGSDGTGANASTGPVARGPRKPSCEGGTCSPCGEGICPNGFYCEVASQGRAPACAWLPACGDKPSCACLTKAAPGCTCEDKGGAPLLTCN